MIVACDWHYYICEDLPIGGFVCGMFVARTQSMTIFVLLFCRFDPGDNQFSFHICISLNYGLRQVLDSTELYTCLTGSGRSFTRFDLRCVGDYSIYNSFLNIDSRVLIYYDFRFIMLSELLWLPKYGLAYFWTSRLYSFIFFKMLVVTTELEHDQTIISITFLYWSYLVMRKKKKKIISMFI